MKSWNWNLKYQSERKVEDVELILLKNLR